MKHSLSSPPMSSFSARRPGGERETGEEEREDRQAAARRGRNPLRPIDETRSPTRAGSRAWIAARSSRVAGVRGAEPRRGDVRYDRERAESAGVCARRAAPRHSSRGRSTVNRTDARARDDPWPRGRVDDLASTWAKTSSRVAGRAAHNAPRDRGPRTHRPS